MTVESDILGGRLPLADPTTLVGAQRELFDVVTATAVPWANGAGFRSTTGDGWLIGPFNPFLLKPAVASKFLDLQFAEQSQTSLSERVRQVVILAVGATRHLSRGVHDADHVRRTRSCAGPPMMNLPSKHLARGRNPRLDILSVADEGNSDMTSDAKL